MTDDTISDARIDWLHQFADMATAYEVRQVIDRLRIEEKKVRFLVKITGLKAGVPPNEYEDCSYAEVCDKCIDIVKARNFEDILIEGDERQDGGCSECCEFNVQTTNLVYWCVDLDSVDMLQPADAIASRLHAAESVIDDLITQFHIKTSKELLVASKLAQRGTA